VLVIDMMSGVCIVLSSEFLVVLLEEISLVVVAESP